MNKSAKNLVPIFPKIIKPIKLINKTKNDNFLEGSLNPDKTCENDFIHKGHNKVIKQAKIGYIKDISPPKTEPKKFTIDTIYKITPAKRVA